MKKIKKIIYLKLARKMNQNSQAVSVPSIISENTQLKGDIISNGTVHIDGQIEGDISCEELVIGVKGIVHGSVTAKTINLYGCLEGKATAENLFIAKTAKLIGDAAHVTIAIEPGAYIDGHCVRKGAPIPAEQGKENLMLTDNSKSRK